MRAVAGEDENDSVVGKAVAEATGSCAKTEEKKKSKKDVSDEQVVVLGSGNLGLVYLMDEQRRMTLEEIDARHPKLIPALREHQHVGFVLVRSADGAVVLGPRGTHRLADGHVEGEDPLADFSPRAAQHLLRADGFQHCPDLYVNSFYDPELDQGCAFEELISFHGGLGGPQTRPFLLVPAELPLPDAPIVGAAANAGLRAAGERDAILLNNDTLGAAGMDRAPRGGRLWRSGHRHRDAALE